MEALNYTESTPNNESDDIADDDNVCSICLEPMTEHTRTTMPCKHRFHTACVMQSFAAQKLSLRQCFYCRTGFDEMQFTKESGQYVHGLHSSASLDKLLKESSTDHASIDWDTVKPDDRFYITNGKNKMQNAGFVKITKSKKTLTLRMHDGRLVQCVCHNAKRLT